MGVLLVLAVILSLAIHQATKVAPTCYDKKQNQGEVGTDCGGPCTFYCVGELRDPVVRWKKLVRITPGVYHAVAYIEHGNPTAAARLVAYTFKVYDEKNTLITERSGTTFLGPMGRTALIETLIRTGNIVPDATRTQFAFTEVIPWEKIPVDFSQVVIKTDRTLIEPGVDTTRLTATLENTSRYSFTELDIDAILYDRDDNVITVSKAFLPSLPGISSQIVYFTWPFAMPVPVARVEVIPRFNPFTAVPL